jgi:hypothetical protein
MNLLETVVELAKEVGKEDPIDFGYLSIDEDTCYDVIASRLIENALQTEPENRVAMLLASATHLVIENQVLHMKLLAR